MSYLYELLTKYNGHLFEDKYDWFLRIPGQKWPQPIDKDFKRFVVTLNVSPEHPLTEEEKAVYDKILTLDKRDNLIIGTGYDHSLGEEAEIISISASDVLTSEPEYFRFEGTTKRL